MFFIAGAFVVDSETTPFCDAKETWSESAELLTSWRRKVFQECEIRDVPHLIRLREFDKHFVF